MKKYNKILCIIAIILIADFYLTFGQIDIIKRKVTLDSINARNNRIYINDSSFFNESTKFLDNIFLNSAINWISGNVIFVPMNGNIQTYVDDAEAGSTLILSSGVYTIISTITIDKQLNIIGQGSSGFVTTPITPSHGTLITSSTSLPSGAIQISNDNIRISDLSINLTGVSSLAINTSNNLQGITLSNIDVIVNSTGVMGGFVIYGTDVVMRNLTFYITSTNTACSGVWL